VSQDGGKTFVKPKLGLVEFDGSKQNNIVLGKQINSTGLSESIEPGTVFIDTNPACKPNERFKMVATWSPAGGKGMGATMFASADGFLFKNMTAEPQLVGSDSQDVVFWDARLSPPGYVYYGRSHMKGGQTESCSASLDRSGTQEPGRTINRFVIGPDITKWPISNANTDQAQLTILNTDAKDPPCTDIYTNVATQLGDAYFFFPMMFSHFDTVYSQGRGNDGLLEARMVVSRNGQNLSYIDRGAWLSRGSGEHRRNATGVYEGAFDAASTAVLVGLVQTETETIMYGWGSQYTHGGYVGFTQPPCRGKGDGPCPIGSGIQTLRLRKNGFVSLSSTSNDGVSPGIMKTQPFALPTCGGEQVLQLNIFTAIGAGARVELLSESGALLARSFRIEGGSVAHNVSWMQPVSGTSQPATWKEVGTDMKKLGLKQEPPNRGLALRITLAAGDLYSMQVLC